MLICDRWSLGRAKRQIGPSVSPAHRCNRTRSLLPGNTESLTSSTGGLGALTLDLEVPEVTETSMVADLLHALEILSKSGINNVRVNLAVGSVLDASLSVEEPLGDAVLSGLGEDVGDLVDLILGQVSGSAVHVDLGDLAGQSGESPADTLDDAESEGHLLLAVDVGVHHTEEVLEVVGARQHESGRLHQTQTISHMNACLLLQLSFTALRQWRLGRGGRRFARRLTRLLGSLSTYHNPLND